jgi:hypothetical protein
MTVTDRPLILLLGAEASVVFVVVSLVVRSA